MTVALKAVDGLVSVNAEALTVPATITICGELVASSVSVMVSVRLVALAGLSGAKLKAITQFAFGAIAAVQELAGFTNSDTFAPPDTTLEICSGAFPEFVTVKFIGLLVVP